MAKIEATSFVSPKAVPNLRDAEAVMAGIERNPAVTYVALVPNSRGAERALVDAMQSRLGSDRVLMSRAGFTAV